MSVRGGAAAPDALVNDPVLILSDLHMGHPVSRLENVSALRPLIAGAGTVIWNGDTWQELTPPFYARSAEMLEELHALCKEEGVQQIHLPGNHDPGWQGDGWVELADGKIIVTHGDSLFDEGSPWKREILLNADIVRALWAAHPTARTDPRERLHLAREIAVQLPSAEHPRGKQFFQRVWDAAIPPRRALKMLEAWFSQHRVGDAFCQNYFPNAEILVIGHFHRPGQWQYGSRRILNTGSFMNPSRARWVEWHNGWLHFGKIDESPHECRKGKILGSWQIHALNAATS